MTMELDGAAVLAALARNPADLAMTRQQVDAVATYAIALKLKEKKLSLDDLRVLASAIGADGFKTIVGNLPAKDAKSLSRLDEKHPDYKTADEHWHRARVIALGLGLAEPAASAKAPKPAPPQKAAGSGGKASKIGTIMGSEALAAGLEQKKRGGGKKSKSK